MLELKYALISILSFFALTIFRDFKKLTYIVSVVPFILFLIIQTIIDTEFASIFLALQVVYTVKYWRILKDSEFLQLSTILMLWIFVFVQVQTSLISLYLSVFLMNLVVTLLFHKNSETHSFIKFMVIDLLLLTLMFVLLIFFDVYGEQENIQGNISAVIMFLILGSFRSGKLIENVFNEKIVALKDISYTVDMILKPMAIIFAFHKFGGINLENVNIYVFATIVVAYLACLLKSFVSEDERKIFYRVSFLNVINIIFITIFSDVADIRFALSLILINFILYRWLEINRGFTKKLSYRICKSLFFSAPFSPIFMYKFEFFREKLQYGLTRQSLLLVVLMIIPVLLYSFIQDGDKREV